MAYLERKTVNSPQSGLPETTIVAVTNGWMVYAGRQDREMGMSSIDRVVAAFESFDSLSQWLKEHIEDNTAKP